MVEARGARGARGHPRGVFVTISLPWTQTPPRQAQPSVSSAPLQARNVRIFGRVAEAANVVADVSPSELGKIEAADFFTTEVWTARGLVTYHTLVVLDLCTRRVHVAGSTPHPDDGFMTQPARRLTEAVDGFLVGYL
jgi:hypothetical protein